MNNILSISNLNKTYKTGFNALTDINLDVRSGEIFALLGPNGAGKTTLINTVCGIVTPSAGTITVDGHDITKDFRITRSLIGLVPQELSTDSFETVWHTVNFSRGLFGKPKNHAFVEKTLRALTLWEKRNDRIMTLSGGMKRRVMIAKALSHEPRLLFLDEPTAGVDVSLRKDMWEQVRQLQQTGVTIILTTHYLEEAEEMADRIAIINKGRIIVTGNKKDLMKELGQKTLTIELEQSLMSLPKELSALGLQLNDAGNQLIFHYAASSANTGVAGVLDAIKKLNISFKDIQTEQTSLEEIFIDLVKK